MGAADPITAKRRKNSRNNVFRSKQTNNKLPPNIFRSFEERRNIRVKTKIYIED